MNTSITPPSKQDAYTILSIFVMLTATIALRALALPFGNLDTEGYIEWYDYISQHGFAALGDEFAVYSTPYLYLLWFARRFLDFIPPEIVIKLIPVPFDILSAFVIFRIARIHFPSGSTPWLASSIFFCLPTIMANSSLWGQIDSLYTSFLLLCFYMLLTRKPFWALLFFGVAFSVKAQAVFFLPVLGILFLKKQIHWYHFLLIPAVYFVSVLPAVYAGRSWESLLTVYLGQFEHFKEIAKAVPNPYIFIPRRYYNPVFEIGLATFAIFMLAWTWVNWKGTFTYSVSQLALLALTSVTLVPFLLPKMHDRYFYPADVFSFVTAMIIPRFWFVPILFQVSSGFAYTIFLFGAPPIFVHIAASINSMLVVFIFYHQVRSINKDLFENHVQDGSPAAEGSGTLVG